MVLVESYNEIFVVTPSYKMTFSLIVQATFLGFLLLVDFIYLIIWYFCIWIANVNYEEHSCNKSLPNM